MSDSIDNTIPSGLILFFSKRHVPDVVCIDRFLIGCAELIGTDSDYGTNLLHKEVSNWRIIPSIG